MPAVISHRGQGVEWFDHIQQKMVRNTKDNDFQTINYFCTTPGMHNVDHIEVDVRVHNDKLWVGHDKPEYQFPYVDWYNCPDLIVHCKTLEAVKWIQQRSAQPSFDYFFHDNDEATFTRKGKLWVHPKVVYLNSMDIPKGAFVVITSMILARREKIIQTHLKEMGGICTDYPKDTDEWLNVDDE